MDAIAEDETDLRGRIAAIRTLFMLSLNEESKALIKANDDKGLLKMLYNSCEEGIQQAGSDVIWEIEGKKEHNFKSSGMSAPSFFI